MTTAIEEWMKSNLHPCSALGARLTKEQCQTNREIAKTHVEPGIRRHCLRCEGLGSVTEPSAKKSNPVRKGKKPVPAKAKEGAVVIQVEGSAMAEPQFVEDVVAPSIREAGISAPPPPSSGKHAVLVSFEGYEAEFEQLRKLSEDTDGHSLADDILSIMLMFLSGNWRQGR